MASGNPVIAIGVLISLLATPLVTVLAGRSTGRAIGMSLLSIDVAQSLAVTVAFISVLAGCILAVVAPGEEALGEQLTAAPLSRTQQFWGMTAIPVLAALGILFVIATLFALPFAAAGPGGTFAGIGILALSSSGLAIGLVLIQGFVAARRGAASGVMAVAAVGIAWPLCGLLSGGPAALGVFGWLAPVLAGQQAATGATLLGLGLTASFASAWVALCLRTPLEAPVRRERSRRPLLPKHFVGAVVALGLVRVVRRRELRHQAMLVAGGTIGGALLLYSVVPASLGFIFVFCSLTAIIGAAICPLAVVGLDARGRWLWSTVPISRRQRAISSHAAALLAGWAVLVVACTPVAALSDVSLQALTDLAVLSAVVFSAALVAGALLPWAEASNGEQLVSYAIFAVIAGSCWMALGWLGRQAISQGLPEPAVLAALPTFAVCAGLALSAHLIIKKPS